MENTDSPYLTACKQLGAMVLSVKSLIKSGARSTTILASLEDTQHFLDKLKRQVEFAIARQKKRDGT